MNQMSWVRSGQDVSRILREACQLPRPTCLSQRVTTTKTNAKTYTCTLQSTLYNNNITLEENRMASTQLTRVQFFIF